MEDETVNKSQNAEAINNNIRGFNYNPREILAFNGDRITSYIPRTAQKTADKFIVETKTKHTLTGDFDIAVPNARKDITYPGALLLANQKLIEGVPDPLVLHMRPRKITIDLPGLEDDNSMLVENYDFAGVSAATSKLINNWLQTKSKDFTIAANTQFKKNILFNENSMALSFGVDVQYMKDKLGINFDAISKQESSAYLVQFRQIFYTVSAELPKKPADVFADDVTWDEVAQKTNNQNPPAYVQNVQYGREVYVLLQSNMSSTELKAHLDASLEFNKGSLETKSDLETKKLNKNINCTVITIGGKPVIINGNLDTDNIISQVNDLISQNAEFTAQNPPLPIAYTVAFLKDNAIASVQGSTEYITTESQIFTSGSIELRHNAGFVSQFNIEWEEVDYGQNGQAIVTKKRWEGNGINRTLGFFATIPFPPNARNIRVRILDFTGLAWDGTFVILDQIFNLINKRTFAISGTTLAPYVDINPKDIGESGPASDNNTTDLEIQYAPFNFDPSQVGKPQPMPSNGPRTVFTPGGPVVLGGPSGDNEKGKWYKFDKFFAFKEMKYQNSCFPCSVHTILANLGYLPSQGSEVEDLWNRMHKGGLDKSAPNEMQIHHYLARTFELGARGSVHTPMNFTTMEDTELVKSLITKNFLGLDRPVGLVAGVGHAEVFFRTKEGRFIHFKPSPELDSIVCEYVLITKILCLPGSDGTFAIGIEYYDKEDKTVQAAHFAMIIS